MLYAISVRGAGHVVQADTRPRWMHRVVSDAIRYSGIRISGGATAGVETYVAEALPQLDQFLALVLDSGKKWIRMPPPLDVSFAGGIIWIGGTSNQYHAGEVGGLVTVNDDTYVPPPVPPPAAADVMAEVLMWCYGFVDSRPVLVLPARHPGAAVAVPVASEPGRFAVMCGQCCGRCAAAAFRCAEPRLEREHGAPDLTTRAGRTWYVTEAQLHALTGGRKFVEPMRWMPVFEVDEADPATVALRATRERQVEKGLLDELLAAQAVAAEQLLLHTLCAQP